MQDKKVKVFIVDDNPDICSNVTMLLSFYDEMVAVGSANSAEEAFLELSKKKEDLPDVILMDINMSGMDGIAATEIITEKYPAICVVIISVQGEREYLQSAISAGAKGYLVKPFECEDLIRIIKQALKSKEENIQNSELSSDEEQGGCVYTVFSTKAGTGKTTIAVNLAMRLSFDEKVVFLDTDIKNGDSNLFFNIEAENTLKSYLLKANFDDNDLIEGLYKYNENLYVLPAITAMGQPYNAELSPDKMMKILKILKKYFPFVVVDTMPYFSEANIATMQIAEKIVLVTSLDMSSIKNSLISQELLKNLKNPKNKYIQVLNRENSEGGMNVREAEKILKNKFDVCIPSAGKIVMESANKGKLFVEAYSDSQVAKAIEKIAKKIFPSLKLIEIKQEVISKSVEFSLNGEKEKKSQGKKSLIKKTLDWFR